jgi:DNA-binding PadR family transcriptional regulator
MHFKKKRFSSEFTSLSILEYLYLNSQNIPVSKYNIINNTPLIKKQRPDRVNLIISLLESNGYIKKLTTSSSSTFYQITEKGKEAYSSWIRHYLEYARNISDLEDND